MPETLQNFFLNSMNLKVLLVLALLAVLVAVPTVILLKWARNFPPALQHPKLASGVGGWLIVFLIGQVAWFLRGLWETFYLAGELFYVYEKSPGTLQSILVAVLPTLFAVLFGGIVLWQLIAKRTPSAIAAIIILLWLMGPGVAMLQSWYFDGVLTEFSLFQLFGWALAWTLYFAASRRIALTYGTPRGRQLASSGKLY